MEKDHQKWTVLQFCYELPFSYMYYGNHIQWFCYKIVMVSVSPEPMTPSYKKRVRNWKCLGPDSWYETLYYSTLKLKYSPSILKHKKDYKKYASFNNSHDNCHIIYTNGIFLHIHMFRLINRSLHPMGGMPWIILRLWRFLCIRDAGCRGNKITAHSY